MRIAIYGLGKYYEEKRGELTNLLVDGDELVAYIDRKFEKKIEIDGIPAINPCNIKKVVFDRIIIMSGPIKEIRDSLIQFGVDSEKIFTWKEYIAEKTGGSITKYSTMTPGRGEKILVITYSIRYDGGSMAALYLCMALRMNNYNVCIVSDMIKEELKENLLKNGIDLAISPELPYVGEKTMSWMTSFSVIIVNVFSNIHAACILNGIKPILWWIHESDIYDKTYSDTFDMFPAYKKKARLDAINIVAVSDNAGNNFKKYFPDEIVRIMPYGIPDEIFINNLSHTRFIFAIIGTFSYLKGQDIFLDAAAKVVEKKRHGVEFWLIGKCVSDYAKKLQSKINGKGYIKIKGEMNRYEMKKRLSEIDVVVSASREDSLPIVVTEGMMNSKVCIVSDAVGSVKYIKHMENGIIFRSQDVEDLAQKMLWCIDNRPLLLGIGKKARDVYERFFSMKSFSERLEKEIIYTKNKFKGA